MSGLKRLIKRYHSFKEMRVKLCKVGGTVGTLALMKRAKDFFMRFLMDILGIMAIMIGAVLTYTSNAIVKAVFKADEPKTDKRSIILKFIGLVIVIAGVIILMDVIY
jgi:hypothetical protein